MEQPFAPELIWIDEPEMTCPLTGGPIEVRKATFELVGTGAPPESMSAGWSAEAGCWYALLDVLFEWTEETETAFPDAGPFRVNGREVVAAVHLVGPGQTVAWEDFSQALGQVQERATAPPPTADEVRALPELSETWELAVSEFGYTEQDGALVPLTVAVVVDAGGTPRQTRLCSGAFSGGDLLALALASTRSIPDAGLTAARPKALRVEDPALAERLAETLAPAGIHVEHGPTPLAHGLLHEFNVTGASAEPVAPAIFGDAEDDALSAYLDAARAFFAATPWERMEGNRYLGVQVLDEHDAGPWLYANVMGQNGMEPGLSLFSSWMDLCKVVHRRRGYGFLFDFEDESDDELLEALETVFVEGVTLLPRSALAPQDAERIARLDPRPTAFGQQAMPLCMSSEGFAEPSWPLDLYTALLTAVPDVLSRRRARTITSIKKTVEAAGLRLNLRYPAHGDEALTGREGDVRLVVKSRKRRKQSPDDAFPAGFQLVIEGPPETRAYALTKAIQKVFDEIPRFWGYVSSIGVGEQVIWHGRAYATDPGPTLDQLASLDKAWIEIGLQRHSIRAERLPSGSALELRVTIE